MKKQNVRLFLSIIGVLMLASCENESIDESINHSADVYVSIPRFDSFQSFSIAGARVYRMTEEERYDYEKQLNFVSMQSAYNNDWIEYQALSSYEDFLAWKNEKKEIWHFDDDDFFTIPINRSIDAGVVNTEGFVIINETLHDLKNSNDSFYDYLPQNSLLKSKTTLAFAAQNKDNRRVEARLSSIIDAWGNGPGFILEVRGYKKSLWKWKVYTTNLSFEAQHNVNYDNFGIIETIPEGGVLGYGHKVLENSNDRFSKEAHKITYTFSQEGLSGIVKFKVWTRGVPETSAVYVQTILSFDPGDIWS